MWIDRSYYRVGTNVQDVYDGRDTTRRGGVRVTRESEYKLEPRRQGPRAAIARIWGW